LVVVGYGLSERLLPSLIELHRSRSASGQLEQPITYWNGLGLIAATGLVLAIRVAGDPGRERALRAGAAAAGVPLALGVYLSFSRGALAAVAAGALVLLALAPAGRPQARATFAVLGTGVAAALVASRLPTVHLLKPGERGDVGQGLLMLAALAALAAAAAGIVLRRPAGRPPTIVLPVSRRKLLLALTVCPVAVALVATALESKTHQMSPRTQGIATRLQSIDTNRYRYWDVALQTWTAHPIAGVGSGGFFFEWRKRKDRADQSHDAHSLYLETAAELGLVGLAMLLLFVGGVAAATARLWRAAPAAAVGPAAALVVWTIHAGLDWDWEIPAVSLPALLIAAATIAWSEELAVPVALRDRDATAALRTPSAVAAAAGEREPAALSRAEALPRIAREPGSP
jgi:O-antigen ligase